MPTRNDLEKLKREWLNDPCWDIEDTEGYEAYFEELRAYRLEWEGIWRSRAHGELLKRAKEMGISDNLDLARYLLSLEDQIKNLSRMTT